MCGKFFMCFVYAWVGNRICVCVFLCLYVLFQMYLFLCFMFIVIFVCVYMWLCVSLCVVVCFYVCKDGVCCMSNLSASIPPRSIRHLFVPMQLSKVESIKTEK